MYSHLHVYLVTGACYVTKLSPVCLSRGRHPDSTHLSIVSHAYTQVIKPTCQPDCIVINQAPIRLWLTGGDRWAYKYRSVHCSDQIQSIYWLRITSNHKLNLVTMATSGQDVDIVSDALQREPRFVSAWYQIRLLNVRVSELRQRHQLAERRDSRACAESLQLQLTTTEGMRSVYREYVQRVGREVWDGVV